MKILLFSGAGTSIELGVPGMEGLATEFLRYSRQWEVEPKLVQEIIGNTLDIEHLIEELDRMCLAKSSLNSVGHTIKVIEQAEKVRAEVEWFVQHTAERITAEEAQLMWGPVLQVAKTTEITFVTTNYDRAIELAANSEGIQIDDGFEQIAGKETAHWVGFSQDKQLPKLVKLHGSTNWFADNNTDSPKKLRHPMPLFGRSVLSFEGRQLCSALVLPSREKMLTKAPYPRLSQTYLNSADHCDLALFVGSSLRDAHIRDAVKSIAERVPVFIVNPYEEEYAIEGAEVIAQHASTFLISTLPNALLTKNPESALRGAANATTSNTKGILSTVSKLLDVNTKVTQRCLAIDILDQMGVTLPRMQVEKLLHDNSSIIARYALGLIPLSTVKDVLFDVANSCDHVSDPAFNEDLDILRKLISSNRQDILAPVNQLPSNASPQVSHASDCKETAA
ncbi:MAG: SIR2 family protein [Gammaproteobacteria bacterium]|nr:SIR2 family protein [Gammaproteobacteria bacterium]